MSNIPNKKLFATTSWSLVSRTREPGEDARRATADLCRLYWQPLYFYARRAGQGVQEAEDTIQDFLSHVVEHDVFARADAARGRFRTFLLSSLQQFMARQHRDASRQKRSPQSNLISLDIASGERVLAQSFSNMAPAAAFDRAWAVTQLDLTWRGIEEEFAAAGKAALCERLRPVISGQAVTPIREIAAGLGMSEGAVNVAVHRLRTQFGERLRQQVADTLVSPDEVDDEITQLRAALAGRTG